MSWSKLEDKSPKPCGWWYHKVMCEYGWWLRNNLVYATGENIYYKHLNRMVKKYGINVYGVKVS